MLEGQKMIGETVSHYKVLKKIGSGGMGVVYKAEDTKLHRIVALKFLPGQIAASAEDRRRFELEAQAAAALNHPNITTIYNIEEDNGEVFIVMEYVDGVELKDKIKSGPLHKDVTINYALQIAQGLNEAHKKGIIHRDIKSQNIMITGEGKVKIMDFGLAKIKGGSQLTKVGSTVGTVAYISPEQARGEEVDQRTDIWSFGIVFYEMLTGKIPFTGDYDQVIIYSIMNEEPQFKGLSDTNISADIIQMLRRLLEKNQNDRYQDVEELISDLNLIKEGNNEKSEALSIKKEKTKSDTIISKIQSIAVLPLENLSNDKEQEYFVSGMHEELLTGLTKIKALRVISRTSVMQYKNTGKTASEIARELNVDALIEGSVLKAGENVRINIQLIDGRTDKHLWAENYDRNLKNIFTMLSEVAQAIAEEIAVNITQKEKNLFSVPHPVNPEVQLEYFKGRYAYYQFNSQGCHDALNHFKRSTDLDPNFALGYAGQAAIYFLQGFLGFKPYPEVFPMSRSMAIKAINLDDGLAEAHTAMGAIKLCYDWEWEEAKKELERALELCPNDAIARHIYGDYLTIMGYPEEGLKQINLGKNYDPFSPITLVPTIYHLIFIQRYDEIIDEGRKILIKYPNLPAIRNSLQDALWLKGNYEESYKEFLKTWSWDANLKEALEKGYKNAGPRGAIKELAEALAKNFKSYTGSSLTIASLYALVNEKKPTLDWLEKACQERAPFLVHLKAHPAFNFIRSDPQFRSITQIIGFPE